MGQRRFDLSAARAAAVIGTITIIGVVLRRPRAGGVVVYLASEPAAILAMA